jgi:membrane-bound lytic murein transglycosylase MltF
MEMADMCQVNHRRATWWAAVLLAVVIVATSVWAHAVEIPAASAQYRRELTRNARMVWGIDAPIATFAAQVHQESGWRPNARSAYAHGLSQFTPATAEWIGGLDPLLAGGDTGNPVWALRALVRYDLWLWDRAPATAPPCDRMAFVLAGYNGGWGWIIKERRRAPAAGVATDRWWGQVEMICIRSQASCLENRGYPRRILRLLEPSYIKAGWGVGSCQ